VSFIIIFGTLSFPVTLLCPSRQRNARTNLQQKNTHFSSRGSLFEIFYTSLCIVKRRRLQRLIWRNLGFCPYFFFEVLKTRFKSVRTVFIEASSCEKNSLLSKNLMLRKKCQKKVTYVKCEGLIYPRLSLELWGQPWNLLTTATKFLRRRKELNRGADGDGISARWRWRLRRRHSVTRYRSWEEVDSWWMAWRDWKNWWSASVVS